MTRPELTEVERLIYVTTYAKTYDISAPPWIVLPQHCAEDESPLDEWKLDQAVAAVEAATCAVIAFREAGRLVLEHGGDSVAAFYSQVTWAR